MAQNEVLAAEEKANYWFRQCQTLAMAAGLDAEAPEKNLTQLIATVNANKKAADVLLQVRASIQQRTGQKMANSWEKQLLTEIQQLLNMKVLI